MPQQAVTLTPLKRAGNAKKVFLLCGTTLLNAVDTKLTSIAFDICLLNNINILSSRVSVVHDEEVERLEEKQ